MDDTPERAAARGGLAAAQAQVLARVLARRQALTFALRAAAERTEAGGAPSAQSLRDELALVAATQEALLDRLAALLPPAEAPVPVPISAFSAN